MTEALGKQFLSPDSMIREDDWSDLSQFRSMPSIDLDRLHNYRMHRIRQQMQSLDVSVCVMTSPISLRYAVNYRNYALFSSHIPCTYLFVAQEGPFYLHAALDPDIPKRNKREGRPISYFYGGDNLTEYAAQLAADLDAYLSEVGAQNRRVALEYINPSVVQALESRNIEVLDGVRVSERARQIKSADELECMRWAMRVAEHGADQIKRALQPGVSELQLWALLNYTNLANNGDWHDGRMLASGSRINPWLQEASPRKIKAGDLLGFDTDMVGPLGYFADLSRTFCCGDDGPSTRQKELYQLCREEVEFNLELIQAGSSFKEIQEKAFRVPREFQENAYTCIVHGVGMCDEFPHIHPRFRGEYELEGQLAAGMVVCVESYMGALGERDGVKLEQQVLVTDSGYELITEYPFADEFL